VNKINLTGNYCLTDKKRSLPVLSLLLLLFLAFDLPAQQVPDTSFTFRIRQSAYDQGKGPVIYIDQAHNNFHTMSGGFAPFSKLLEQDGYKVQSLSTPVINDEILKSCSILVIANALNSSNTGKWILPTPSAFTEQEITNISLWVKNGGKLFLIADHMPFAGAAYELGKAFGFEFINGFAMTGERSWPPSVFCSADKTLPDSPIKTGLKDWERTDSIATFTGSAFKPPPDAMPVLSFLDKHYSLQPDTAWRFNLATPTQHLKGFSQGAILQYGNGKVAVFGEAAMFTAQTVNGNMKVGFNSEFAPRNAQFALNLVHWLDGVKEYSGPQVPVSGCKVTYVANEGYLIETATCKILIDALFGGIKGNWCDQPGDSVSDLMINGKPPFDNIDLVLVTHKHTDHFSEQMVIDFLKNNLKSFLICPLQVNELLKKDPVYSKFSARIRICDSTMAADTFFTVHKVNIEAMQFGHGSYFITDSVTGKPTDIHKGVENIAYLIEADGYTIFHSGDCSSKDKTHFETYGFAEKEVDLAFLDRTFLGHDGQELMNDYIHAKNFVFMHCEPGKKEFYKMVVKDFPEMTVFTRPLEEKIFFRQP
jgi:L-ascorbate metabolism protein UlaG (beta-lactamase superfamily)